MIVITTALHHEMWRDEVRALPMALDADSILGLFKTNELYWNLISPFKKQTSYGLVVNTSFNVRGEPIVCSPDDAYRCFMRTGMDWLVINNYLFSKAKQKKWQDNEDWQNMYELD